MSMVVQPFAQGANGLFEYTKFLPRVFFPDEIMTIKGKEAILDYMSSGKFDPQKTAILEKKHSFSIVPSDRNEAVIFNYSNQCIKINAEIQDPCLMVVSEVYYPAGWKVFVDGQEREILKTDYLLRSVYLEPGSHKVEFRFEPVMFKSGLIISLTTFILLVSGIVFGYFKMRRKDSNIV